MANPLRTDAEIAAAARAAAAEATPLTDEEVQYLAGVLAPVGESRRADPGPTTGAA
jgi:hypothetical protein